MKHAKQLSALFLLTAMCLSLFACTKGETTEQYFPDYFFNSDHFSEGEVRLSEVEAEPSIDVQSIYDALDYTPRMFYGRYALSDAEGLLDEYTASAVFVPYPESDALPDTDTRTAVPYRMEADCGSISSMFASLPGYEWMRLYFLRGSGELTWLDGAYFIDGHTLRFYPLIDFSVDTEAGGASFRIADYSYDYGFSFHGRCLSLSQGEMSVDLYPEGFCKGDESADFQGYLQPGSPALDGLNYLHGHASVSDGFYSYFYVGWDEEGETSVYGSTHTCGTAIRFTEDGLCTIAVRKELNGVARVYQFAYFFCGDSGLILTDGETVYDYSFNVQKRRDGSLAGVVDASALEKMSDESVAALAQTRESLLDDQTKAMQDAGIGVSIDREAGEVRLDAAVLFASNDYAVSEEGKALLQKFINAYTSVLTEDKYTDFISEVLVEGHTDDAGDYEASLTLSQNRAESVLSYCLSEECGLSAAQRDLLEKIASPVGYSYDRLIFNPDGTVNMDASRRVTFRFRISLPGADK